MKATESSACKMFDGLTRTQQRMIEDFIDPVLPLVGISILGLLLAGRGAWLRRRT